VVHTRKKLTRDTRRRRQCACSTDRGCTADAQSVVHTREESARQTAVARRVTARGTSTTPRRHRTHKDDAASAAGRTIIVPMQNSFIFSRALLECPALTNLRARQHGEVSVCSTLTASAAASQHTSPTHPGLQATHGEKRGEAVMTTRQPRRRCSHTPAAPIKISQPPAHTVHTQRCNTPGQRAAMHPRERLPAFSRKHQQHAQQRGGSSVAHRDGPSATTSHHIRARQSRSTRRSSCCAAHTRPDSARARERQTAVNDDSDAEQAAAQPTRAITLSSSAYVRLSTW
jgi:hypothetical protein